MTITNGYDAIVLINEGFLNRGVEIAYYSSIIPQIKGSIRTDIRLIPRIDYVADLIGPPVVEIRSSREARALVNIAARFSVLGIDMKATVAASLSFALDYDRTSGRIAIRPYNIDVVRASIGDIGKVPSFLINPLNRAISIALARDAIKQLTRLSLSVSLPSVPIPMEMLEDRLGTIAPGFELASTTVKLESPTLPIKLAGVGLLQPGWIYAAINFLDHDGGMPPSIGTINPESGMQLAVSAPAINSLFTYLWPYLPHEVVRSDRIDVPDYRTMMDSMVGIFDAVRTFGVKRSKVRFDRSWVDFGAKIEFGTPVLMLKEGARLEIVSCPLSIDAWADPKMLGVADRRSRRQSIMNFLMPTRKTEEKKEEPETISLIHYTQHMDLTLEGASINIGLGPDGMPAITLSNLNLAINLPWKLPKQVLEQISNWLVNQIVTGFPAINIKITGDLVPDPYAQLIKSAKLERIQSDGNEVVIQADLIPPIGLPTPTQCNSSQTLVLK